MSYRIPIMRRLAIKLHSLLLSAGHRLERSRDLGLALLGYIVILSVVAIGGCVWLPITGTLFDAAIWIAVWAGVNVAVVLLLRRARWRRHGSAPSKQIRGSGDVLLFILLGWGGVVALGTCAYDLTVESSGGWALGAGLLAAGALIPVAIILYRYVTEAPDNDDARDDA